ncbi:SIR2-like protein [Brachybacterium sp. AG952]|uniref:SIR2 family NAD-dependent protein deacylase n=1 Tax=Brachybacterium sp. AG952 TaxID=2183989 RepID=UPI00106139BD|nr:SIR2 family protein [Brachybacterium sp. AG952]TDP78067.1 SIR2-like protein [Brachybacterium sp. AG952]
MSQSNLRWPSALIDAVARGECMIFIGAGISRHAKQAGESEASPVGWRALLEHLLENIVPKSEVRRSSARSRIRSLINSGDYLGAAQSIESIYMDKGLSADFRKLIAETVDGPSGNPFMPSVAHDLIAELNPRTIVTTNYDNILERKFSEGYRTVTYESTSLGDSIRTGAYTILKIHGTKDDPQGLVLTRLDFTRLRRQGRRSLELLEALFMTRTVLFTGYSLGDPDLQLILENQFGAAGDSAGHFMLAHNKSHSDTDKKILREAYGVEILPYEGDRDAGLIASLEGLVAESSKLRMEMTGL